MTELKWEKLPEAFNNVATGAPEPVFNSFLRTPIKSFDAAMSDFVDRSLDDFGEMGDLGMLGGGSDPNDYEKAAYQLSVGPDILMTPWGPPLTPEVVGGLLESNPGLLSLSGEMNTQEEVDDLFDWADKLMNTPAGDTLTEIAETIQMTASQQGAIGNEAPIVDAVGDQLAAAWEDSTTTTGGIGSGARVIGQVGGAIIDLFKASGEAQVSNMAGYRDMPDLPEDDYYLDTVTNPLDELLIPNPAQNYSAAPEEVANEIKAALREGVIDQYDVNRWMMTSGFNNAVDNLGGDVDEYKLAAGIAPVSPEEARIITGMEDPSIYEVPGVGGVTPTTTADSFVASVNGAVNGTRTGIDQTKQPKTAQPSAQIAPEEGATTEGQFNINGKTPEQYWKEYGAKVMPGSPEWLLQVYKDRIAEGMSPEDAHNEVRQMWSIMGSSDEPLESTSPDWKDKTEQAKGAGAEDPSKLPDWSENLSADFFNKMYAQPGSGRADVRALLPKLYSTVSALFFMNQGLDAWNHVALIDKIDKKSVKTAKDKTDRTKSMNALRVNYDNYLEEYLQNPMMARYSSDFESKVAKINRVLNVFEEFGEKGIADAGLQQDFTWVDGLFGASGDQDYNASRRKALIDLHLTQGGMGRYSHQIHNSAQKLIDYYGRIGKTPAEIFKLMTGRRMTPVPQQEAPSYGAPNRDLPSPVLTSPTGKEFPTVW